MVINAEPVAPRQLAYRLDRDLETIILKCLEKSPDRRYASAAALADDLRRYLGGHPIVARPVGRIERAWRWCRRRPVEALLLLGIVVTLLTGSGVSTFFGLRARAEAGKSRVAAAKSARAEATAVVAAQFAEQQSEKSVGALEVLIDRVAVRLEGIPEADEARREILQYAAQELDQLTSQFTDEQRVGVGRARALMQLAALYERVGDTLGENGSARSLQLYQQAAEMYERLDREGQLSDANGRFDWSLALGKVYQKTKETGASSDALRSLDRAAEIREELLRRDPDNLLSRLAAVEIEHLRGMEAEFAGNRDHARQLYDQAIETMKVIDYEQEGIQLGIPMLYAEILSSRAYVDLEDSPPNPNAAGPFMRRSHEVIESLQARYPDDPGVIYELSTSYERLSDLALAQHDDDQALKHLQRSLELTLQALERDPRNIPWRDGLSNTYGLMADLQRRNGRKPLAIENFQKAFQIRSRQFEADPAAVESAQGAVQAANSALQLCVELNERERAHRIAREVVDWIDRIPSDRRGNLTSDQQRFRRYLTGPE
jgi:serine/threonine-protein kinase